ncbi:MAG: MBL fold metallo-hydrolase [Candidatus Omnitrophica bacterium]|nr:MBL fold metallo-hydrolase [Candidatus Omnitrophota bacterium]
MRVIIHGARSGRPVSGAPYRRYGGSTSCFSVETGQGLIILDAGTGLASIGEELARRATVPPIAIFFTHFHLDHVMGLPAFQPFYQRGVEVTLRGYAEQAAPWPHTLKTVFGKPLWPVELLEAGAAIRFEDLPRQGSLAVSGATVSWCPLWHPQTSLSYRLEVAGRAIVLATDGEHGQADLDRAFLEFCRGAEVLIHDAQYTPDDYPRHRGWGHTTWEQAARRAAQAGVGRLILTSHDPSRSDDEIDRIVEQAKRIFPNTSAAAEQMVLAD